MAVTQGEVAKLKDNINEMILNHQDTTRKYGTGLVKTNLARFTRMLQGQRDMTPVAQMVLSNLLSRWTRNRGVFYVNAQLQWPTDNEVLGGTLIRNGKIWLTSFAGV